MRLAASGDGRLVALLGECCPGGITTTSAEESSSLLPKPDKMAPRVDDVDDSDDGNLGISLGSALGLRLPLDDGEDAGEPDSRRSTTATRNSVEPCARGSSDCALGLIKPNIPDASSFDSGIRGEMPESAVCKETGASVCGGARSVNAEMRTRRSGLFTDRTSAAPSFASYATLVPAGENDFARAVCGASARAALSSAEVSTLDDRRRRRIALIPVPLGHSSGDSAGPSPAGRVLSSSESLASWRSCAATAVRAVLGRLGVSIGNCVMHQRNG